MKSVTDYIDYPIIAFFTFSMYYRSSLYVLTFMSQCSYVILKQKATYLPTYSSLDDCMARWQASS